MKESALKGDMWIRRFHSAPAGAPRLVCLPHAGGSASFYFPLSEALHDRADVLAVQYPGRQDRRLEEPIDDIGELADRVFEVLRDLMDLPTTLFGHSMGAVTAFEVARRMERNAGISPAALIVSGRRAPSRSRADGVHRRDDDGVIAELKRLSGTDASLLADEEVLRMILPAVRSDYRAIETYSYQPGPKLNCPIFAFMGDRDPQVTVDDARAWSEYCTAPFDLQVFSGGHFYMDAQREATVARILDVLGKTAAD